MNKTEFMFNLFYWETIGTTLIRDETLFPNKTYEVAADYLISAITIAPKAAEFALNAMSLINLTGESQDKYLEWEAEQEVVAEIKSGKSPLSQYFLPQNLNHIDKKYNPIKYSRGTVLNITLKRFNNEGKRRKYSNRAYKREIFFIRKNLDDEIKRKYHRKKNKKYYKSKFDKYDVENGGI